MQSETVALVGTALSSRADANGEPESTEVWSLADAFVRLDRVDAHFELHPFQHLSAIWGREWVECLHFMQKFRGTVYVKDTVRSVPNSVVYPLAEVRQGLGLPDDWKYFSSTLAYMIALAIHKGFKTIKLFGFDLAVGEEYEYQKANAEFCLGLAMGRGIKVVLPKNCPLLKGELYSLGNESGIDGAWVRNRLRAIDTEIEDREAALADFRSRRLEVTAIEDALYGIQGREDLHRRMAGLVPSNWKELTGVNQPPIGAGDDPGKGEL